MTRSEQELVVMQYLNGELSPEAEESFFVQVATDPDLRQTLNAFRVVETALRKHRDTADVQHPAGRTKILAALAMTEPVADAAGRQVDNPEHTSRHLGKAAVAGGILATTASKWVLGTVAVSCIAIGTFAIAPMLPTAKDVTTAKPARLEQSTAKPTMESVVPSPSSTPSTLETTSRVASKPLARSSRTSRTELQQKNTLPFGDSSSIQKTVTIPDPPPRPATKSDTIPMKVTIESNK